MAPARAKIIFSFVLALCLLIAGAWWLFFNPSADFHSTFAPEKAKLPASASVPEQQESVQEPTAEILSKRIVEYHIDAKLDPTKRVIQATQTLTWTHPGKKQ
ncbi:hypothetical protein JCM16418_4654 [Paenibacillus pini JCM 16418]|uniref:Uncharacterized protein n=1 Tax=Paenibacillus pini JCM 16418 TaxID=1236976 RepID=W7YTD0_9BACL|nr:hypothetical protein JCM16418_4654 [Paenibacillus pini JCM 16418]